MGRLPMASTLPSDVDQRWAWRHCFEPESRFIRNWNRILLLVVIFNVFLDPLFLFLPIVISNGVHIKSKPASVIILLAMIGDSFCLLGMIIKFRTAYEASLHKKRLIVKEPKKFGFKYLKSTFLIDFVAILPLPQVYLWCAIPRMRSPVDTLVGYNVLVGLISIKILPKLYVQYGLRRNVIKSFGMLNKNDWLGPASYLLYYIMLSHMAGALYYSLYIARLLDCKTKLLYKRPDTGNPHWDQLLSECSMKDEIDQGIFSDAYQHKIGSRSFTQRYMYCFSWGLKCLSSMAQNFDTTFLTSETIVSFFMTIFGLLLFAGLIAQMQTSIQALGTGEELQMVRHRDIEEWTKQCELPSDLRKRVKQTALSEWRMMRGLDDEAIMETLPSELQQEIRRHLHLELVSNLPFFANVDEKLVHSFCGYLRAHSSYKGSFITVEGEPVGQMFLIVSGQLEVLLIDDRFSTSPILGKGDVCGQELLLWASCPSSSTKILPSSNQTLRCLTDVEAFIIPAEDLKFLAVLFEYNWSWQQMLRLNSA